MEMLVLYQRKCNMLRIKNKKIYDLPGIISPMCIYKRDGFIYVFDKINMDEGRLYKYSEGCKTGQLVLEVDEGDCYFGRNELVYILYQEENSRLEVYNLDGNKLNEFCLSGTVYYIDIDEKGYIYALSSEDERAVANKYDENGRFIRSIHSRNMSVILCVYFSGESLFAGGFSEGTPLCLEEINYMSYIEKAYNLIDRNRAHLKLIISKVVEYKGYLVSLVSSVYGDSLVFIDEATGKRKTYNLAKMGMNIVFDFIIKENNIYLLGEGNAIAVYDLAEDELSEDFEAAAGMRKPIKQESYGYISYLIFIKNILKDFLRLLYKFALPVSSLFTFYFYIKVKKSGGTIAPLYMIENFAEVLISADLIGVAAKNIVVTIGKRFRIDNVLDIYNRIDKIGSIAFRNSLFGGVIIALQVFCILIINGGRGFALAGASIGTGICSAAIFYAVYNHYVNRFKRDMGCSALELLSLDYKDHDLFIKIEKEVKKLRKLGTEKYRIKIFTNGSIGKGTVRLIKDWSYLRKKITGDTGKLNEDECSIVFDIDLKNRDIKYSRVSVIEDFLCYIYKNIKIASVIIEKADDKNENSKKMLAD